LQVSRINDKLGVVIFSNELMQWSPSKNMPGSSLSWVLSPIILMASAEVLARTIYAFASRLVVA